MSSASASDWVSCPVCGERDMRQTTVDGDRLINCVNHNCASNGGTNASALTQPWAASRVFATPPTGWSSLPEDEMERRIFDANVETVGGDARVWMAQALRIIAAQRPGGSFAHLCVVMANEVLRLHVAPPKAPSLEAARAPGVRREMSTVDLSELATWLHAACDRPPQTPECKDMLARVDAALSRQGGVAGIAHQIWAAAQLTPGESIEDGVGRIEALLVESGPFGRAVSAPGDLSDDQRAKAIMWDAAKSVFATRGGSVSFKDMTPPGASRARPLWEVTVGKVTVKRTSLEFALWAASQLDAEGEGRPKDWPYSLGPSTASKLVPSDGQETS